MGYYASQRSLNRRQPPPENLKLTSRKNRPRTKDHSYGTSAVVLTILTGWGPRQGCTPLLLITIWHHCYMDVFEWSFHNRVTNFSGRSRIAGFLKTFCFLKTFLKIKKTTISISSSKARGEANTYTSLCQEDFSRGGLRTGGVFPPSISPHRHNPLLLPLKVHINHAKFNITALLVPEKQYTDEESSPGQRIIQPGPGNAALPASKRGRAPRRKPRRRPPKTLHGSPAIPAGQGRRHRQ
jgi:hypothetical protein